MNLCILSGKIINEIDLKFIYNSRYKKLERKHISIVEIELEMKNEQKIKLCAYDEIADCIYRSAQKSNSIIIEGKVRNNYIEINDFTIIKQYQK